MGDMAVISQDQLQRMLAWLEADFGHKTAIPEMHMVGILGYRQPLWGQVNVNQQVMVAGECLVCSGGNNGHSCNAEFQPKWRCDCRASFGSDKKYAGVGRCRLSFDDDSRCRGCLVLLFAGRQRADEKQ